MTGEYSDTEIAAMRAELAVLQSQAAHNQNNGWHDERINSRIDALNHKVRTGTAW